MNTMTRRSFASLVLTASASLVIFRKKALLKDDTTEAQAILDSGREFEPKTYRISKMLLVPDGDLDFQGAVFEWYGDSGQPAAIRLGHGRYKNLTVSCGPARPLSAVRLG